MKVGRIDGGGAAAYLMQARKVMWRVHVVQDIPMYPRAAEGRQGPHLRHLSEASTTVRSRTIVFPLLDRSTKIREQNGTFVSRKIVS